MKVGLSFLPLLRNTILFDILFNSLRQEIDQNTGTMIGSHELEKSLKDHIQQIVNWYLGKALAPIHCLSEHKIH